MHRAGPAVKSLSAECGSVPARPVIGFTLALLTMNDRHRSAARELAAKHLGQGDPLGWFDLLYRAAEGQRAVIPWADLRPNPHLAEWLSFAALSPGRALVIGCGLGDDAELLASRGWSVVAFDISAEAIRWARERFPQSAVEYQVVDLFDAPGDWRHQFDLVVEAYTLQVLPPALRARAVPLIADWVAVGGLLCLIARGRGESDPPGQMPWPLTEAEVRAFVQTGLNCERFDDYMDREEPAVRRFRGVFGRTDEG
jgi:SAM-dependent methyltransferase